MITVVGVDDSGRAYQAYLGVEVTQLFEDEGVLCPASYGELTHGTELICAALRVSDGELMNSTPTGPPVPLSANVPETVLMWLQQNTEVVHLEGWTPSAPVAEAAPGAIY